MHAIGPAQRILLNLLSVITFSLQEGTGKVREDGPFQGFSREQWKVRKRPFYFFVGFPIYKFYLLFLPSLDQCDPSTQPKLLTEYAGKHGKPRHPQLPRNICSGR
jgi:hypothetical protein